MTGFECNKFRERQGKNYSDSGISAGQAQTVIPYNATFQTKDLDTYDSDCDDLSTAQAVLMANISNYGSDIISELIQIVLCKFLATVRLGNDQIARIMGYGDYQMGNVVISRVYYVEGLGRNLFSVGQSYDADLELAKDGLARGIPRLKFQKDHLCSACALGKSKKSSHQPKDEDTNQEKLYLLHMDLRSPMHVASINGKRQVRLNVTIQNGRTDNGTEFVNQTLREFYENVGILHQTSVARTPQQNGVVERRNWTLVEAARTMLIFSKALLFLWAEAINTACYTQNRSPIQ
ncbi:retrovirus-related pol polyprotein from transposon TNT 1-94 [Tanacetum coccineum]